MTAGVDTCLEFQHIEKKEKNANFKTLNNTHCMNFYIKKYICGMGDVKGTGKEREKKSKPKIHTSAGMILL